MLRRIFNTEDGKRLLSNFLSLSILQVLNYILPLLTFPYLVNVIGVEKFGLISFATAIISYFVLITDFGFNFTAVRDISLHRENKSKLSEIFSSVMIIKLSLLAVSAIVLLFIIYCFDKFWNNKELYLFSFGIVIGQTIFPVWFFQGIEKMKYITILNIFSKFMFTILIFFLVKSEDDYWLVPLLTSIGSLVAGLFSLILIRRKFGIIFHFQSLPIVKNYFFSSWYVFLSRIFGSLYRESNIIILGIVGGDMLVGYYSISEKVVKIIQMFQNVFGNTLFPYFSKRFKSVDDFFKINKKYFKYVFSSYLFISVCVFLFSDKIIYLLSNNSYSENMVVNLRIMSSIVTIGGLNYYFGILGLLSLNYKKEFSQYVINTGIISLLISSLLIYIYNDIGASLSFVISEIILLIHLMIKMYNLKYKV